MQTLRFYWSAAANDPQRTLDEIISTAENGTFRPITTPATGRQLTLPKQPFEALQMDLSGNL